MGGAGAAIGAAGGTSDDLPDAREAQRRDAATQARPQLPGGGRTLFPRRRVVAFYGNPADRELGALGIGTPDQAAGRLARVARSYDRPGRRALPCLELIVTVAAAAPGDDGQYRLRSNDALIRRYLKAARRNGALLLLDVQPGRSNFPAEVSRLLRWLREPDVGLALDPEWRVGPGQVPGQVIGSVNAAEVNAVSDVLAQLVRKHDLPQKLFVIHQFTNDMVRDKPRIAIRPELATTFSVDGFGTRSAKVSKYRDFTRSTPPGAHDGFKVFFNEDVGRMAPRSVMGLKPPPDLVMYE